MFPALLLAAKTYTLPPDKLAKAIAYAAARNRLHFIAVAYGILVLVALLAWHVAPRLRTLAESATRRRILQAYIFAPLLLLAIDLLELPISLYGHHLSLQFEQSIQGWPSWFWDWTKGELLLFALAGIAIWVLYGAMRLSPRRWWLYFWMAAVPMVVFLMFIEPLAIEPLFFKFEPLAAKQPALVAAIEKVTARGGLVIPPDRMFEMIASEKLKSLNAYVTGIGASKRVVVWDTTIEKMNAGQTLFVFGHEMGHYVLGHVWIGIGAALLGILIFLFLAYHAMRGTVARYGARWQIRDVGDWASLPVLLLALAVFSFLGEPLSNSFSRVLEHKADVYGLEVTHGILPDAAQAAADSFQVEGESSLAEPDPNPLNVFLFYDHPPISDRVRFLLNYNPWAKGKQPEFVK